MKNPTVFVNKLKERLKFGKKGEFKMLRIPKPLNLNKTGYRNTLDSPSLSKEVIAPEVIPISSQSINKEETQIPTRDVLDDIYSLIQPKQFNRTPKHFNISPLKRRRPFSIFGLMY